MVPGAADPATEVCHWQRYLFFRPWYEDAVIIDAASGEGYGANYASTFATKCTGVDISDEAVIHATRRYPHTRFKAGDVCEQDYSGADLVLSFETIEHLDQPVAFLKALSACQGRIVISTPNRALVSPGNGPEDKPLNQFHTREWTPTEFAELIEGHFSGRTVRFLSQDAFWPGTIREGLDEKALFTIAVIGDGEIPKWPRLGIAVPTYNNSGQLQEAIAHCCRYYPGDIEFAVVANGCDEPTLVALREFQTAIPNCVHVIESPTNLGYGVGVNVAWEYLTAKGFDYYGVSNDDVVPATDCLCEMTTAMQQLVKTGYRPGAIGPVSNLVTGQQQVDIGQFTDLASMQYRAEVYHREHHSNVDQVIQLRGLFMLIHPDCLQAIGGFDPRFGIGNFEDDDFNLRAKLAGFTSWIATGAFLFHYGSTTFRRLAVDYEANIKRNAEHLARKWGLSRVEAWTLVEQAPAGTELYIPLGLPIPVNPKFEIKINGEHVDMVSQASDIEFLGYVLNRLQGEDSAGKRVEIIEMLEGRKLSA